MKNWILNNWPKLVGIMLLTGIILFFINRESIMNHRVTKAKMEIFDGIKDRDKEKIRNGIDSIKLK